MGTLTEEILSRKLGRHVRGGEIVVVDLDLVMSHDDDDDARHRGILWPCACCLSAG